MEVHVYAGHADWKLLCYNRVIHIQVIENNQMIDVESPNKSVIQALSLYHRFGVLKLISKISLGEFTSIIRLFFIFVIYMS